jgi:Mitochondrial-associated sphingomyelin phosphodiesterase
MKYSTGMSFYVRIVGPTDVTSLDQLKRCVLPSLKLQIYSMFKYTFTHWPHDLSFRLVLETWLSYIQVIKGFFK